MFVCCCLLFAICCVLFVVCCLLFDVRCLLFVVDNDDRYNKTEGAQSGGVQQNATINRGVQRQQFKNKYEKQIKTMKSEQKLGNMQNKCNNTKNI